MNALRRLLPLVLAAVLTGTIFFFWRRSLATPTEEPGEPEVASVAQVQVAVAGPRTLHETIELLGVTEPEPNATTLVSAQAAGRIRQFSVKEGDLVQAGQVLAELEPGEAPSLLAQAALSVRQEQLKVGFSQRQAEASLRSAQALVKKAEGEQQALLSANQAEITKAKAMLATAQRELERVKAGSRPQELAAARAALTEAEAQNQSAQLQLKRTKRLLDEQVVSQRQWEEAQATAKVADGVYQEALQQVKLTEEGNRKEDIAVAEARVAEAQSGVQVAESARLSEAGKRAELTAARAQVASAQSVLEQARAGTSEVQQKEQQRQQAQIRGQYLHITAPISGIVVRRAANVGDTAQPGTVLLELGQPGHLRFRVGIPETRLARLRAGQAATVRFDSLADKPYAARVSGIGQGTDGSGNGVAWLTLLGSLARELRVGLSGKAKIALAASATGVVIPAAALVEEEQGDAVVVIDSDSVAHRKKVKVGLREGDWVALTDGLAAGERVVTIGAHEVAEGGKVNIEAEKP
ncbi:efflux RND transporter periplasmic adaptor subunit [Armatimonas sp.]|uniref:efflux RND transporter periplasmic adaptor subunit n=1 Tax=Armatimonas sp. TaxID=1872638 RepID=UPI00286B3039|nr:efflux RND transporter periplasmic adaptor subunit [Armatimonas sp.]